MADVPHSQQGTLDDHFGSALTHALAALVSLPAFLVLRGVGAHVLCVGLYGGALVGLFLCSALYHATAALSASLSGIHEATGRQFGIAAIPVKAMLSDAVRGGFRRLDYVFVVLFSASAVTPLLVATLGLDAARPGLTLVWLYAGFGFAYELLLRPFLRASPLVYLGLAVTVGYALVPAIPEFTAPVRAWMSLAAGFLAVGLVFFRLSFLPLHHSAWHVAVIGFAACHYVAVAHAVGADGVVP